MNRNKKESILIVDDDERICNYLAEFLSRKGYQTKAVTYGQAAIDLVKKGEPISLVILDIMMPGLDGIETLKQIRKSNPGLPVLMLSALGQTNVVVEAIKVGAFDFIVKPFEDGEIEIAINNALEKQRLLNEVKTLKERLAVTDEEQPFLFLNPKMNKIKEIVDQVAGADLTVLILGESGVGKELVAREIYKQSPRRNKPFIKVNCAAIPLELLESELFGYERGAFTGAFQKKPGKFELAHRGTIFLDEIGHIGHAVQAKLLQVLQDGVFSRLGGKGDTHVDVRVIAATNRDLAEAVKDGSFREDLYYRLNVVQIEIPPLRERRDEIPMFVDYFLKQYNKRYRKNISGVSDELMDLFMKNDWPGNIRELENLIKRIVVLEDEKEAIRELKKQPLKVQSQKTISKEEPSTESVDAPGSPEFSLREVGKRAAINAEKQVILRVLDQTNWNRRKAAEVLNISYKALLYKMKECGLSGGPQ